MLSPRAQSWNRRTLLPSEERFQNDLKSLEQFHASLFESNLSTRPLTSESLDACLQAQAEKIQSQADTELLEKSYVSARLLANSLLQQEFLQKSRENQALAEVLPALQATWFWRIYMGSNRLLIPKRMLPAELSWFVASSDRALFEKQRPLFENWLQGFFSPYFSKKNPLRFTFQQSTWRWERNQ